MSFYRTASGERIGVYCRI